jgi:hypothetical protein
MKIVYHSAIVGAGMVVGFGLTACQNTMQPAASPPAASPAPAAANAPGSRTYDPYTGGRYAPDVQSSPGSGPQVIPASR